MHVVFSGDISLVETTALVISADILPLNYEKGQKDLTLFQCPFFFGWK
jgi:hypothetical protein